MIHVLEERCTGCGTCVGVCPTGALSLRDGRVDVDGELCTCCEACVAVCLQQALAAARPGPVAPEPVPPKPTTLQPVAPSQLSPRSVTSKQVAPKRITTGQVPAPWPGLVPALGTLLGLAVRELLPRLGPHLLDLIDHRTGYRGRGASGARPMQRYGRTGCRRNRGNPRQRCGPGGGVNGRVWRRRGS